MRGAGWYAGRMADEIKPLTSKIEDWLSKQGCLLECRTHDAFERVGFGTQVSTYINNSDGVPREIDVLAQTGYHCGTHSYVSVNFVCECKYSANFPWVVMDSKPAFKLFRYFDMLPRSVHLRELKLPWQVGCYHFSENSCFGHTVLQAFRPNDKPDLAYQSLHKIANAAWDLARDPKQGDSSLFPANHAAYVFPCIVVDAPLFVATLDADQQRFTVREVNRYRLAWAGAAGGTLVDILRADDLEAYAIDCRKTTEQMGDALIKSLRDSNVDGW